MAPSVRERYRGAGRGQAEVALPDAPRACQLYGDLLDGSYDCVDRRRRHREYSRDMPQSIAVRPARQCPVRC